LRRMQNKLDTYVENSTIKELKELTQESVWMAFAMRCAPREEWIEVAATRLNVLKELSLENNFLEARKSLRVRLRMKEYDARKRAMDKEKRSCEKGLNREALQR